MQGKNRGMLTLLALLVCLASLYVGTMTVGSALAAGEMRLQGGFTSGGGCRSLDGDTLCSAAGQPVGEQVRGGELVLCAGLMCTQPSGQPGDTATPTPTTTAEPGTTTPEPGTPTPATPEPDTPTAEPGTPDPDAPGNPPGEETNRVYLPVMIR